MATKTKEIAVHLPSVFQTGDVVRIARKIAVANSWADTWSSGMDELIGYVGLIINDHPSQGLQVKPLIIELESGPVPKGTTFWYPSPALILIERPGTNKKMTFQEFCAKYGGSMIKPIAIVKDDSLYYAEEIEKNVSKKKTRKRVGPGPWDNAPCTHLRWQLMGFFREKLAIVKTTIKVGDVDVAVDKIDVACTKCGTKMTLQAK